MLNDTLLQQLRTYLQNLKSPVELITLSDNSAKAEEIRTLAEQIAALSDQVSWQEQAATEQERQPSLIVKSVATGRQVQFAGVPLGHEFTSLVLALLHSGGHPMKLEAEVIEQIKNLKGSLRFETYISLSCHNCPDVVQALNMMALLNPNIEHVMIDGALFPEEVSRRNIMAVPSVYLNGEVFSQGRSSLAELLAKLDQNDDDAQAAKLNQKPAFDMLVVGGGPAGASAAIYAARKGINTGLVASRFGGQVQDTVGIENFISVKATEGPKLVAHLEEHVRDYDVDLMPHQSVSAITPAHEVGGLIEVTLANGAVLKSRSVLLATGARWREMNVPGEQAYRGKGVAYCPHCDGPLFKGKKVAVIGGGNSGIEAAIDLAGIVQHVTVLEFSDTLRADEVLLRKARSMANIEIITEAQTTEVLGDGEKVIGLAYTDRRNGEVHQVELAGIFVQIGLVPNTEFVRDTLALNPRGEIVTGAKGETNVAGIFAAGDVTDSPFKQIIIAMGDGANAALGAFDYLIRTPVPVNEKAVAA
ncbi:alkyl hydroperoxide reductase subunit F [Oceanospirillum multiglobuliferum]|uniref:Alkyl hydroperoxide reductase subunit F n=1 Tax=Oceanospirillum multiglobuliferum TaxID=64969 RepID=A0A1T4SE99_9GAMM|nr:alkyl hydroperoxide reductase subunit F [Oceanospirillum multiglobuliferum]OPX54336.1 alkyl hydroperoxide reductase subunit F [Oceanospirillum multiglobuliferum]SKA26191.1 alkyl hydroperoxide reductase subunit F [Oceanospirillum multiglobuliferum]